MKNVIFACLVSLTSATCLWAQSTSVHPMRESDKMYKKTITRALDLREQQNKPLFARNREISKLLMEAVERGDLSPYNNDSLTTRLTIDQFKERIRIPGGVTIDMNDTVSLYMEYGENWREEIKNLPQDQTFLAQDLYQMEIKEYVVFDKQQSRLKYDIQTLTIFVPADHPSNTRGIQTVVASFSYNELVEKVFKNNPQAMWYNTQNEAQHKNLADAFELRLFSSYITKVGNANDQLLADIYKDEQTGRMASEWAAMNLLEYEHNLWEY